MSTQTDQFKNQTRIGSKTRPGERFKNQTSIEKTNKTKTLKQQAVVDSESIVKRLTEVGFQAITAKEISNRFPLNQIDDQLNWIAERNPSKTKVGMLRRAIEQNWGEPDHLKEKRLSRERYQKQKVLDAHIECEIQNQKRARVQRRVRLIEIWQTLGEDKRASLKDIAIANENSKIKREILLRKGIQDPPTEFLDALAIEKGLPPVTLA